jgi:cytochrome c553
MACSNAAADPQPLPPSQRFELDMMVRLHMHENFGMLRAIEKLLVRGKLVEARELATAIAEAPDELGLGAWAKDAAIVRERAASLAKATDVDEASHRAAELAGACASCHVDAGVAPEFRSPGRMPIDRPTVEARMARHLWATDRLWEGIVGGADDAWRDGLDVLAATPLRELPEQRMPFARRLQSLADRARMQRKTETLDDRVRSYGDILATCAGCHAAK